MDIKIALGKIEQYWQIIRNLHFHIEQEGQISSEEYALIEKYLKVISQKYKELIDESVQGSSAIIEQEVEEGKTEVQAIEEKPEEVEIVAEIEQKDIAIDEEPYNDEIDEPDLSTPVIEEKIIVKSEISSSKIEELIPDIASQTVPKKSISSFLEQMLESPENVPEKPIMFSNKTQVKGTPSLNEKLKDLKTPVEDLNSKIKKATADKISLNSKFEFIKELFGNNPVEYAAAIQQFDTYGSMIWDNVEREFSQKFNWSSKEEMVEKFKALVVGK